MYEPMPGSQNFLPPISNPSMVTRKNQPPAMLIMLFQIRPMVENGSSTQRKRCHQLKR